MTAGGVTACSDERQLADVCRVADLALVTKWYGDGFVEDGTTRNDCRFRSELMTVNITAAQVKDVPTVHAMSLINTESVGYDDALLDAYLGESAYGAPRVGPTILRRVAGLQALPDLAYPCSTAFVAGNEGAIITVHVWEDHGARIFGPIVADFGSGLPSTNCSDLEDENHTGTIDERWPATYSDAVLDAPPGTDCGPATLHLTGVTVFPPDGTTVDVGDVTMTNANWMIEPPMECRRT